MARQGSNGEVVRRVTSENTAQTRRAERFALEGESGLVTATHQRTNRPRQRREQDDAEGERQRGVKPCGVDAGRSGFEYHEGRSGIDAPAHDAAVLDLGGEP